jgi:hypothetical protein
MKPNDLKVVGCRLITGTARYIEFTMSDGQTMRVADRAKIEAIVAGSDSGTPIDGAVAAFYSSATGRERPARSRVRLGSSIRTTPSRPMPSAGFATPMPEDQQLSGRRSAGAGTPTGIR